MADMHDTKTKQTKLTEQVQKYMTANSYGPATREMRTLADKSLVEAVLNVSEGHEDAPELVLVFKYLSLDEANLLASVFGMEEVQIFGGRTLKESSHVELSGYVSGTDWNI